MTNPAFHRPNFLRPPTPVAPAPCAVCRHALDLSQPDPGRPSRLVGVCRGCGGCGAWWLLDTDDRGVTVGLRLPADLHAA